MTNFKNSIIATIIAVLCIGQQVFAEFVVENKAHITALAILQLPNGPVQQILQPGERWVVDAAIHDNAKKLQFSHVENAQWPYAIRDLQYLKDWKTLSLILNIKAYHTYFDIEVS